jgi:hypothetical protein
MFKNAVIAVNWSGTNVDAAALARCLCAADARLTLAHVHAEVPMSPDPLVMDLRKFEMRHSTRALKGAAFATKIDPTLSVSAPSVSDGVSGLMSMVGADLLVLGPVERNGAVVAELSEWLTRRPASAPSAVAIVNQGFAQNAGALRRIGVIREESGAGEDGVLAARQLADAIGSRLKVLEIPAASDRSAESRGQAQVAQRLAEFSGRVDVLVSSILDEALGYSGQSPLLLINRPATRRPLPFHPASPRLRATSAAH